MPGPPKQPYRESELHDIVKSAPDLAPATRERYMRDLNHWIDFAGPSPSNWTPATAEEFYSSLIARMQAQSAARLYASLEYAAKWWANRMNRPDLNFTRIRKARKTKARETIPLEAVEAIRLLDTCERTETGDRDYAILVMGLETGMRRMSLAGAYIENLTSTGIKVPIKGSGLALEHVPLTTTAVRALVPWMERVNAKRGPMFRPITLQNELRTGRLKAKIISRPLSEAAIYTMIRSRCRRAGIVDGHPHVLRHTFTSWRVAAGYQPHEIAAVTRHSINLGAIEIYMNKDEIAKKMRDSTPDFLRDHVARRVSS